MKHYFIINPMAGSKDSSAKLVEDLAEIAKRYPFDYETHITISKEDTILTAKQVASTAAEETIIYACGGDGTCFDVINGIVGHPLIHFGIIPIGSCNDFLKSFPGLEFGNLEKMIKGALKPIDVIHVHSSHQLDCYCLNEINIGFDARVNDDTNNSKYKAVNVKKAYTKAVLKNLWQYKRQHFSVATSDEMIYDKRALMLICANGQYYGSKYHVAPKAVVDDGLFDLVVVGSVSRLKFLMMMGAYEKGKHLSDKRFDKIITYKQCNKVSISSNEELIVCLDGEIMHVPSVEVELLKHHIRMVFPHE